MATPTTDPAPRAGTARRGVPPRLACLPYGRGSAWDAAARSLVCSEWPRGELPETTRGALPSTLIAIAEGRVAGCGSLVSAYLPGPAVLTVCLSNLVVEASLRRRGVASFLVRRLVREAARAGLCEVYAITSHPGLFRRLGWAEVGAAFVLPAPLRGTTVLRVAVAATAD